MLPLLEFQCSNQAASCLTISLFPFEFIIMPLFSSLFIFCCFLSSVSLQRNSFQFLCNLHCKPFAFLPRWADYKASTA